MATATLLAAAVVLALSHASRTGFSLPLGQASGPGIEVDRNYANLPLSFEPNAGRIDRRVDFVARTSAGGAYLTGSGARLTLADGKRQRAVDMRLLGAAASQPQALDRLPGSVNDLRGDDPAGWETGIPTFERVRYPEVYPGVDLDWHGSRRQLEYDFRLAPGADPGSIALRVGGADRLSVAPDGDLLIEIGGRTLRQAAPVAYQPPGGGSGRTPVAARFRLRGDTVRFGLAGYDRGRPLVIDPIVLDYSTYLGGNGADRANAIDVDSAGAAYITGRTLSTDFDSSGGVDSDGPQSDVFVTKLNPAGDALVYSTYVGGNWHDYGADIAVDSSGAAYVTGGTRSTDFNTVGGIPHGLSTEDAAGMDVFVLKLTPAGDGLAYSTYIRAEPDRRGACNCTSEKIATSAEAGAAIAVDPAGSAYITGSSEGRFPLNNPIEGNTAEADQYVPAKAAHPSDELFDAFIAKLTPDGGGFVYSTMLGGKANDGGTGIAVDGSGAAYITGSTSSPDFDTVGQIEGHNHVYEVDGSSGGYDAFVSKITPEGSALTYSTYLGGNDFDAAHGIAIDPSGAAYITGTTQSSDFNTVSPVEGNSPGPDAFVSKLTPAGDALTYSTYLGGARAESADEIALDSGGAAVVAGDTESRDFDLAGELEGDSPGTDAFVTKLRHNGALACSTYLGGDGEDRATAVALGSSGEVFVAGATGSSDFDRSGGVEGDSAGTDAFASKLAFGEPCPDGPEGPPGPAPATDLRAYVIVLDGLRPHEVTAALTPSLNELKQGGTWYEQARSAFVAETLPNHTAMMTGVLPQQSGIISNDYSTRHAQIYDRPRMGVPGLLEAPTLPTVLEDSCDVDTAVVQSKEYLWHLLTGEAPDPSDPANQRLADYDWSPVAGAFIPDPDGHTPDASVMQDGFLPWLRSDPPRPTPQFAFLNLGDIDRSGHIDESGATTEGGLTAFRQTVLADTDALVGSLVDELKSTGAWDESVLIFTSDHGMDWSVPQNNIDFGTRLREAGFDNTPNPDDDSVSGLSGAGGAMMIYMRRPERTADLVAFLENEPGIDFAATRERVAGSPPNYPGLARPTLAEIGFDHPNTGDVVAFLEPGWRVADNQNIAIPGNHAHPVTQHQTLFVAGGHPALDETPESVGGERVYDRANKIFSPPAAGPGNLSVAPTVAALFGVGEPEGGYDGEPLREAFDDWALEPHVPCGAGNVPPQLSIDDVSVSEGGPGTATFTLNLATPSVSEVRVDYRTADGSAAAPGDYDSLGPTTVRFDPGETAKQVSVPIRDDDVDEPGETFTVELSAEVRAELAKATGTATITDDDPTPQLSIEDRGVNEGDSGTTGANFAVSLSNPSQSPITFDFATHDGGATAPDDYEGQAGTLTFDPYDTASKTIGVTVKGDTLDEPNENFAAVIAYPVNAVLAKAIGIGTILDDDGPPPPLSAPSGRRCAAQVAGTEGNDTLTGTPAGDLFSGLLGSDQIFGRAGPDCLFGGGGDDLLLGAAGDDLLRGGDGRDRAIGGPDDDALSGGRGPDRLSGKAGDDRIRATDPGRDRVQCGSGADEVVASPNDLVDPSCEEVGRAG